MSKEKSGPKNLNKNLKQLAEIAEWFDKREEIDVEEGLEKVKKAVFLIKESKILDKIHVLYDGRW